MLDSLIRTARRASLYAKGLVDSISGVWRTMRGSRERVIIEPYLGWGPPGGPWRVGGRVMVDPEVYAGDAPRGPAANLVDMFKRYWVREIPHAVVEGRCGGRTAGAVADKDGYFELVFDSLDEADGDFFRDVELRLVAPIGASLPDVTFRGRIQTPNGAARYGIVSDVDDTVVRTGAATLWRHISIILFNSAAARVPFPGVSALYRALTTDEDGVTVNPIWYLTASPWNLYGLFIDFMRLNEIPMGTLMMKRFGGDADPRFKPSHGNHKRGFVIDLMETFPDLQFILIGDSGQNDAEIYTQIATELPHRVRAIYLRHVAGAARKSAIDAMAERLKALDVPVVLTDDSEILALHAATSGWLPRESVGDVWDVAVADISHGTVIDDVLDGDSLLATARAATS